MTTRMRRGRGTIVRLGIAFICVTLVTVAGPVRAHATGPTLLGAGSTWVQIALDQWRSDIARQGYTINYQGVGSSAGRTLFIENAVDFAASEIPFQSDELPQVAGRHYQYLPDVAGATTLMYNLHTTAGQRITSLHLDATSLTKMFTGGITSWQDPAIKSLNPGLPIKETTLTPVTRSDGSGTSAQLSLYLADQDPGDWNSFANSNGCAAPCSQWPPFPGSVQQNGSDGVANFIAQGALGPGAIGYVEAGYAFGRGFPVAAMKNGGGTFVQLTPSNVAGDVAIALQKAQLHSDLTQDLTQVYRDSDPSGYPMSSYSYMITPTTGSGFDPAKGAVLGTWLIYIACGGQAEAGPLGYSPLPPNLIQAVFAAVQRIPGAPTPPPIDKAHCPNPTVLNPGVAGGGGTTGPGPGSSSSSNSSASNGLSSSSTAAGGGGSASSSASSSAANSSDVALAIGPGAVTQGPASADPGQAVVGPDSQNAAGGGNAAELTLPSGVRIQTATDDQRAQMALDAAAVAAGASAPPSWRSYCVGGGVLVLVFAPLAFIRRRTPL